MHLEEIKKNGPFAIGGENVDYAQYFDGWHGAAKDSAFQHLAIEVDGTDTSTEWCEAVKEADYEALP